MDTKHQNRVTPIHRMNDKYHREQDQYNICHARLNEDLNNDLRRPIPLLDATDQETQCLLNCI